MRDRYHLLDGNRFIVCNEVGDFEYSLTYPTGFFAFDTRFLSEWNLTLNDARLSPLSSYDLEYFESLFFLVPGEPTPYLNATLAVIRQRTIGGSGFDEKITVQNHANKPVEIALRLDVASDFADIFDIKYTSRTKPAPVLRWVEDRKLHLRYERGNFRRETVIASSAPGIIDDAGLSFHLRLGPHEEWSSKVQVEILIEAPGTGPEASLLKHQQRYRVRMRKELTDWIRSAPVLDCDHEVLSVTYRRSLSDLAALRYYSLLARGRGMLAAGLPWFMTLFGRDSIFASLQALPFAPEVATTAIEVLALSQGGKLDDFHEEEPGKMMHELRYGELAAFGELPYPLYFGSADATPLFVILIDEYDRWVDNPEFVRAFETEIRLSLKWIDTYADLMGNGYIWYQRRSLEHGLENQCWKDSWDGISYRDGRLPGVPRATCEMQGYAYDAKRRAARLFRKYWNDPAYADRLETEAADLRERFNRDFWVEDGEYYALALDGEGGQVDALASNMGHLLWSGIVDESRARKVADHLLGPRLYSGWGIRTLAEGEGRYNPVGYHNGTVWPFDNSFIAWGLRRYGMDSEAARVAENVIEAAEFFNGRLPEAFAGTSRELTRYPIEYPTACSPQAWSAGATLLFLRTMLGLEPDGRQLQVSPAVPEQFGSIELRGVHGPWGRENGNVSWSPRPDKR